MVTYHSRVWQWSLMGIEQCRVSITSVIACFWFELGEGVNLWRSANKATGSVQGNHVTWGIPIDL
jgi:hypothetical protein